MRPKNPAGATALLQEYRATDLAAWRAKFLLQDLPHFGVKSTLRRTSMAWMIRPQNKFPFSPRAPTAQGAQMKLPLISLTVVAYTLLTAALICYADLTSLP
ncbi:hypothetical protein ACFS07_27895 [Undibacterium arcticum]